jgi:hypothetical protein
MIMKKLISLMGKFFSLKRVHVYYFLLALFVLQVGEITYINIFCNQQYLGFDASANFLKAIEIWRQKTLFPTYYDTTSLTLDSSLPIAAFFYGITKNIFVSYGLANLIIAMCLIMVTMSISADLSPCNTLLSKLLPPILILCCYAPAFSGLFNPIDDFFSALWVSAAFYGGIILICLLFIKATMILERTKEKLTMTQRALCIIALCLAIIAGLSRGLYFIVSVCIPVLLYRLFIGLKNSNVKAIINRTFMFVSSATVLSYLGSWFGENILGFAISDSKNLVQSGEFFQNIQSIYLGWLGLFGGSVPGRSVSVISKEGIIILINFVIANLIILTSIFLGRKSAHTETDSAEKMTGFNRSNLSILLFVIFSNLFIFGICWLTYGAQIFENRYLIIIAIPLAIVFANAIDMKFNQVKQYFAVFLVLLVITNIYSIWIYNNTTIEKVEGNVDELILQAMPEDVGLVYAQGWGKGTGLITGRNMRVIDTSRYYVVFEHDNGIITRFGWGDYVYCNDAGDYTGRTGLLCSSDDYENLPEYIKTKYSLYAESNSIVNLYLSNENPIDLSSDLPGVGKVLLDNKKAINFAYSQGVMLKTSKLQSDGTALSTGEDGLDLYGPCAQTKEGKFDFTLNYEVLINPNNADVVGKFYVATDSGANVLDVSEISAYDTSLTLHGVLFTSNSEKWEHCVYNLNGVVLKIISIEIVEVGGETT